MHLTGSPVTNCLFIARLKFVAKCECLINTGGTGANLQSSKPD